MRFGSRGRVGSATSKSWSPEEGWRHVESQRRVEAEDQRGARGQVPDAARLMADLIAAKLAATKAALVVSDSGSCNFDGVRLFGVRWSKRTEAALKAAEVHARRTRRASTSGTSVHRGRLRSAQPQPRRRRSSSTIEGGRRASSTWWTE